MGEIKTYITSNNPLYLHLNVYSFLQNTFLINNENFKRIHIINEIIILHSVVIFKMLRAKILLFNQNN